LPVSGQAVETLNTIICYPTVQKELRLSYQMDGHKVMIHTINLNQDWQAIDKNLKELLDMARPEERIVNP